MIKKFIGIVVLVGAVVVVGACGASDGASDSASNASDAVASKTINGYVVEAGAE